MKNLSARNPLGIIALFISLIYGISALLLGASVNSLDKGNQERLVWFVIIFPAAILFAFLYLVTWHHKKLYGPGDFRSDEGFLSIGDPATIGQKYIAESDVGSISKEISTAPQNAPPEPEIGEDAQDGKQVQANNVSSVTSGSDEAPAEVAGTPNKSAWSPSLSYMLEGLVMQELQTEFKSPIRRDAQISAPNGRLLQVDGIIEHLGNPIFVEMKRLLLNGNVTRRFREGILSLQSIMANAGQFDSAKGRGMLIFLTDGPVSDNLRHRAMGYTSSNEFPIDIRFYYVKELLSKYGLNYEA